MVASGYVDLTEQTLMMSVATPLSSERADLRVKVGPVLLRGCVTVARIWPATLFEPEMSAGPNPLVGAFVAACRRRQHTQTQAAS